MTKHTKIHTKIEVFAQRPAGECPACGSLMLDGSSRGLHCGWCGRTLQEATEQRIKQGNKVVRWYRGIIPND